MPNESECRKTLARTRCSKEISSCCDIERSRKISYPASGSQGVGEVLKMIQDRRSRAVDSKYACVSIAYRYEKM